MVRAAPGAFRPNTSTVQIMIDSSFSPSHPAFQLEAQAGAPGRRVGAGWVFNPKAAKSRRGRARLMEPEARGAYPALPCAHEPDPVFSSRRIGIKPAACPSRAGRART